MDPNSTCFFVFFFKDGLFFFFLKHFFLKFLFYFYLFIAVLGLRFCARAFSICGKRGPLFIAVRGPLTIAASPVAVRGPLTIAASPVAEHSLQTRRLSSRGSRA